MNIENSDFEARGITFRGQHQNWCVIFPTEYKGGVVVGLAAERQRDDLISVGKYRHGRHNLLIKPDQGAVVVAYPEPFELGLDSPSVVTTDQNSSLEYRFITANLEGSSNLHVGDPGKDMVVVWGQIPLRFKLAFPYSQSSPHFALENDGILHLNFEK